MHRLPIFQDSRSFDERTERMIRDVRRQIDEDLQSFGFRRKKLLKPSLIKWDDDDDDDNPASRLLSHDFFKLRPSSSSLKSPGSPGRVSSPPPRKEDYAGRAESVVDDYDPARSAYAGRSQLAADDGRPFCMSFDVKDFEAEDISVTVEDDTLIVQAKRRTERDGAVSTKEFNRKIRLPRDVYPECLSSTLTSDGILTIEAQVPPPDYESAVSSPSTSVAEPGLNGNSPQKAGDAVSAATAAAAASSPTTFTSSSASSSSISRQSASIPLDTPVFATDPSTGRRKMELILAVGSPYKSDDISVKLQGRRLVIEAAHEEKWEGRTSKVSMQRDFDLSEDIDVTTVRALLKNSGQLTITAFAQ